MILLGKNVAFECLLALNFTASGNFETLFGASRARQGHGFTRESRSHGFSGRGQDIELDMPIMLEDTVSGYENTIAYNLPHYDTAGGVIETIEKKLKVVLLIP